MTRFKAKEVSYLIDVLEAAREGGEELEKIRREIKSTPSFHASVVRKLEELEQSL